MAIYYPLTKIKEGEMRAWQEVEPRVEEVAMPIFEMLPDNKTYKPLNRVENALHLLRSSWKKVSREFMLDCTAISCDKKLPNGKSVLLEMAERLHFNSYHVIHCYRFNQETAHEADLIEAVLRLKLTKIAIRFESDDIKLWQQSAEILESLLEKCGLSYDQIIVILDFKKLPANTDECTRLCDIAYKNLNGMGVKEIVFLATSMLDSAEIKPANKVIEVKRSDFALWCQLITSLPKLRYGDYLVIQRFVDDDAVNAKETSKKGFYRSSSPKVRYPTGSCWLVIKGDPLKDGENNQYPRLAREIINHSQFRLNELTWGHEELKDLASYRYQKAKNSEVIAIDVNNHLNLCADQVQAVVEKLRVQTTSL
ncbi:MAG: hypothetical protein EAZ37_13685 [Burkholderiales bacterium]|nr:MAG: hypothetical protein EAZ37_13685 [Burkholderiales bacterium]